SLHPAPPPVPWSAGGTPPPRRIASQEASVGAPTARTHRIEHWLTTQHLAHDNRAPLDAVHAERRRTWTGAPPAARRRLRGQLAPLLVSAPGVPAGTAEPLRWLLESARDGVTLTQAGYLPRALVTEAAERYDWYLPGRLPRTEHDVTRLATLHKLARHTRLLARRHRTLSLTARGRQHLTNPALFQATAATAWYSDHDFTTTIAEAATEALLHGERTLDDLTDSAHTLAAEAFTRTDGSTPAPDDTRHFLWQWLRPGEALGFLTHTDRRHSTITLTATGRAAALTELRRRAHAPHHTLGITTCAQLWATGSTQPSFSSAVRKDSRSPGATARCRSPTMEHSVRSLRSFAISTACASSAQSRRRKVPVSRTFPVREEASASNVATVGRSCWGSSPLLRARKPRSSSRERPVWTAFSREAMDRVQMWSAVRVAKASSSRASAGARWATRSKFASTLTGHRTPAVPVGAGLGR
ncbi:hypothetical protein, partial [Streptomyces sp. NPDC001719]